METKQTYRAVEKGEIIVCVNDVYGDSYINGKHYVVYDGLTSTKGYEKAFLISEKNEITSVDMMGPEVIDGERDWRGPRVEYFITLAQWRERKLSAFIFDF